MTPHLYFHRERRWWKRFEFPSYCWMRRNFKKWKPRREKPQLNLGEKFGTPRKSKAFDKMRFPMEMKIHGAIRRRLKKYTIANDYHFTGVLDD